MDKLLPDDTGRYRCVHPALRTALTTLHRLILAGMCAPRSATLFYQHVLAAGGTFFLTKKAAQLVASTVIFLCMGRMRLLAHHQDRPPGSPEGRHKCCPGCLLGPRDPIDWECGHIVSGGA